MVRLAAAQPKYSTVHAVLTATVDAASAKKLTEDAITVFNSKRTNVSALLHAANKQCRKTLVPTAPALCKALRSWRSQQITTACMLCCVGEATRFLDAVGDPAEIDLLLSCGVPFFPVAQGGPLFYGDRVGWEEITKRSAALVQELFSNLPKSDKPWFLAADQLEQAVTKCLQPVMSKGIVVQTLFPRRPAGLPVSTGRRGLPAQFRRMPLVSSFDAGLNFLLYITLFFAVVLLTYFWADFKTAAAIILK